MARDQAVTNRSRRGSFERSRTGRLARRGAFWSCFAFSLAALAGPAVAQTSSAASTETGTPGPDGSILPSTPTALTFVAIAGLALFLVWVIPLSIDMRRAYRAKADALRTIVTRLEKDAAVGTEGLSAEELKQFLGFIVRPAEGVRGLSRVLLAFLITTLVGVLTLALLFSSATGVFDVVKQIVTALLEILATVIGFYFGARTAESASAGGPSSATASTGLGSGGKPPTGDSGVGDAAPDEPIRTTSTPEMESPQAM